MTRPVPVSGEQLLGHLRRYGSELGVLFSYIYYAVEYLIFSSFNFRAPIKTLGGLIRSTLVHMGPRPRLPAFGQGLESGVGRPGAASRLLSIRLRSQPEASAGFRRLYRPLQGVGGLRLKPGTNVKFQK